MTGYLPNTPSKSSRSIVWRSMRRNALIRTGLLLLLLPIGRSAFGQALPTAEAAPISTGFELPRAAGTLSYAVSANETLSSGYYGNTGLDSSTGLSGSLAYISPSKVYPFSMVFSGGRSWTTSGQPSTLYLNLGLSQVINTRTWSFVLSDSINYLPQTPSTGLSGIPGTGDLGVPPVQVGEDTGQGVLTGYATRVSNTASASAQHQLTGKTSLQVSGSYTILRFVGDPGNDGLNDDGATGDIGLNHRIDARNSVNVNYAYTEFTYGPGQAGFASQTASLGYTHQFSRRLKMDVSAGPQWVASTDTTPGIPATPASINLYANAALAYTNQFANFSLGYSRSTNSGFGVIEGARSDSAHFSASRTFARIWNGAVTSSYTHTTSLTPAAGAFFTPQTLVEAVQISRAVGRSLSAYASYTLENQSTPASTAAVDVFSGHFQVVGFGLTYSPTSIHFGPR